MPRSSRRNFFRNALAVGGAASLPAEHPGAPQDRETVSLRALGGIPNDPKFDNAPIINAALERRVRGIYLPMGNWHLLSRLAPIAYPFEIRGEGKGDSCLTRHYAAKSPKEGLLTAQSGAVHIARIGLLCSSGASGGAAIALIAEGTRSPDYSVIEDVYVSVEPGMSGTWDYGVLIDGTERPNAPIGVRGIEIRNCHLFASAQAACRISGGVAVSVRGGGMFPAGGSTGKLEVTGSRAVTSHYVSVDTTYVGGLALDNCNYINIRAAYIAGDITGTKSAKDVLISGACAGTVQKSFTRGTYISPG